MAFGQGLDCRSTQPVWAQPLYSPIDSHSGESGAGKSETTKLLIQHVVDLCKAGKQTLEQNIGRLNPLLEAFGNAKTCG